jgi:hypothetical protein
MPRLVQAAQFGFKSNTLTLIAVLAADNDLANKAAHEVCDLD